jgi:hypothetical protein
VWVAIAYSYGNSHGDTYCECHGYSNGHSYSNAYSHGHAYTYIYPETDAYAEITAYTKASSDAGTSAVTVAIEATAASQYFSTAAGIERPRLRVVWKRRDQPNPWIEN